MKTEPFIPHADSIQIAWVLMCKQLRISTQPPVEELEAEFDRFLARVRQEAKAEALREAADHWHDNADHTTPADIDPDWLRARADHIETGDRA